MKLFSFGTKAETLSRLQPLLKRAKVLESYHFSVREWKDDRTAVVESCRGQFGSGRLIIRSSAINEDATYSSMAGRYASVLDVDCSDRAAIERAIDTVVSSYDQDDGNQVLVQPMLSSVSLSGVMVTRDLKDGGPYIVINYDDETGATNTVTSGSATNKTVYVYRKAHESRIRSERIRRLVAAAEEIEEICGESPLNIEFGLTLTNELFVFQVRQIARSRQATGKIDCSVSARISQIEETLTERNDVRSGILGRRSLFGMMPDWNPAELLGASPGALAISLFRRLVTSSVWREARFDMGYRNPAGEDLLLVIAGRPYVDVRSSFNSFLPQTLDEDVGQALVDAWLLRLQEHPELHDKVEFEVAQTILDFDFQLQFFARYDGLLSRDEIDHFEQCLRSLTIRAVDIGSTGTLFGAETQIHQLAKIQEMRGLHQALEDRECDVDEIEALLQESITFGTKPFSILARHAFIAEALLRSACRRGALTAERVFAFKRTIRTVLSDLTDDLDAVARGEMDETSFLRRYGHLRPGTFDIRSLRYADRQDLFGQSPRRKTSREDSKFILTVDECRLVDDLLQQIGLSDLGAEHLLEYIERATAGREYAKFVFSKNVSNLLEMLAAWGHRLGLQRDQLNSLNLDLVMATIGSGDRISDGASLALIAEDFDRQRSADTAVKLGAIISSSDDIYVIPMLRNEPNYITSESVVGEVMAVTTTTNSFVNLSNKVACIESADPGFDWIFGSGIAALITKYGGANSHMAIRCAEFGLPAAIGCGEQLFERVLSARTVELNCDERTLRPTNVASSSTST